MSVDVGDAVQLTFSTASGATVTAEVTNPAGAVTTPVAVAETGTTGDYPFTFTGTLPGVWQVTFRSTGPTAVQTYTETFVAVPTVPPLASPSDVAELWRALTAEESALATALIRHASKVVRRKITDIDARVTDGDLDADLVAFVVAKMVLRVMQGPSVPGAKQESETVGPYTRSVTYDAALAARHLYLDADDAALLAALPDPAATTTFTRSIALYPSLGPRGYNPARS